MRPLLALFLLLATAAPATAQRPGDPALRRRAQLEAQLLQRFAQRAGNQLNLSAPESANLARIVQEVGAARRDLNQAAVDLRLRLTVAVRDSTTTKAQFEQLLNEQLSLRQREFNLWQQEQQRLQQVLTPRQLAHFALLWLRLQDDARGLMMQRGLVPPRAGPGY